MIVVMLMQNAFVIWKTWILLYACSTDSVIKNLYYVEEMNNFSKHRELTVLNNGGSLLFDWKGCL